MKSLLLLIILMFQAFILHAQTETIDGFELGGSRITAIGAIGQKSGYKYQNSSTYDNGVKWIEYVRGDVRKPPHSTYDLYFIDDKLTKLEYYTSGFNSNMVEDKYIYIMYFFTCGQPRKKTDRHVTGEKEKSGKKERVRRKNRFPPPP